MLLEAEGLQDTISLKKISTQVISCEFLKIFQNSYFCRTLLVAASVTLHNYELQPNERLEKDFKRGEATFILCYI